MAKNELISTKSGNIIVPDFTKETSSVSIADEPRKIKISCKRKKNLTTGNIFNAVRGFVKLEVIDEDGKSLGVHVKGLEMHFTKVAFKDAINVHSADELKSGYLYVKAKGLQIPPVYKISIAKDKDGNEMYNEKGEAILEYPKIWIKEGIIGNEQAVVSQDALDVDSDDEEKIIDAEIVDEEIKEDLTQFDSDDEDDESPTEI